MSLEPVHALFNHPGFRAFWVKLRVPLVLALVAAVLWLADPRWLLPGFIVSMVGEVIQLWCFASLDKNRDLACNGPYTLARNPMYLGLLTGLVGLWLFLGTLTPAIGVLAFFVAADRWYIPFEERAMTRAFGDRYAAYKSRVRRWL